MTIKPGDHLKVSSGLYTHHGIYVGGGQVVHYAGNGKPALRIRVDTIEKFAHGRTITVVRYAKRLPPDEIVRRAWSRVDERTYHLAGNNCEHFARWCSTGHHHSQQVTNATAATAVVGGGAALGAAGVSVTTAAAAATAAGGAQVMSGLAEIGSVLGGGSAVGLGVLATAPAVAATAAMWRALRDDECLPQHERTARRAGRIGTVAGAVGGVAASVGAIALAGMPGLSAAGITSGLASIGALAGGGMAVGVAITSGLAGLIAALLGYAVYRVARWIVTPTGELAPVYA